MIGATEAATHDDGWMGLCCGGVWFLGKSMEERKMKMMGF